MLLVKVGGGDVDVDAVAKDLAELGRPFVLLHGANRLRDEIGQAMGHPTEVVTSVSGYTSVLSDDTAIDMLLAAYAGIRNKRIVEALRRVGLDAIGLTGLDGGLVTGERNKGIRALVNGRKMLLRDNSGKPRAVNGPLLRTLLGEGYTPVLTVPIAAADGSALNSENDDVLAHLAAELDASEVVSLIEAPGLMGDVDDPDSLVPLVWTTELESWEARVEGRMRRKVRALRSLFERAPGAGPRVYLADGRVDRPVSRALAGDGTTIRASETPEGARARGVVADGVVADVGDGGPERSTPSGETGDSAHWLERQAAHELDVYGKRGLALVSGEGARVWDADGREYIDCIGGHGALALGHRHPKVVEAVRLQADRIWYVPGSFGSPPRARFLERLHGLLPPELDRTFLSNSGTEAVEAALKIARAHTGRTDFVATVRGFHGRTLGALSITFEPRFREPFGPLLGEVRRVPFNKDDRLREAVDDGVAAIVLEPVQGEGGVHPADPSFLEAARAACDEAGALLIFDEVQTGFGRTGKMFAFEHSGVIPDVLCLAKSIASGLPLGATVVRRGIELPVGTHGSTFGGSPIAVAAADATLECLADPELMASVERKGAALAARLRSVSPPAVREIRQVGLMIGVQLRGRVRPTIASLQDRGVLALAAGASVLRLLPPLTISDEELERVGEVVLAVLTEDAKT